MAYVQDRIVHDADSHLMELEDCLDPYFDSRMLAAYHDLPIYRHKVGDRRWSSAARRKHDDPAFRAGEDDNILLRKNYEALGAFRRSDRPKALDLLGFASQLVFTTFCLGNFGLDQGGPVDLCYAAAQAHNRMMTDFCADRPPVPRHRLCAAGRLRPRCGNRPRGHRARGQGAAHPLALPPRPFAQPRRLRRRLGRRHRRPASRSSSTSAVRRSSTPPTSRTACRG